MKRTLLSSAIGLAFGLVMVMPLYAQQAPVDASTVAPADAKAKPIKATQLEAITVSARRRNESLEKVPVAVSAFTSEDLKDLQADNIDGLQGAVPNMNIVQGRGSSSAVNIFIRGIGQPDALQTFDPGVGMYVDDVYYSRIQGALINLFDVERVEVLRGPQGTLYGKNSTGGAVKVVTKNPTDTTEASVEGTVGNFGKYEGKFYLAGRLSGPWSASIAGAVTKTDGYVEDPVTHHEYNDEDTKAVRAKLRYHASDAFDAVLSLDHTKQDTGLTLGQPVSALTRTDFVLGPVVLLHPNLDQKYNFQTRTSFSPDKGQKLTHEGAALALTWKLSEAWNLKSISAFRKLDSKSYIDIDASQFQLGDVLVDFHQKQASQELQLQYDNGSNLQAIYGLYYLNEKVPSHQEAYANDLFSNGGVPVSFLRTIDDNLRTTSAAAFAHVNWEFVPSWTLAAGVRYSSDHKDYDRTTSVFWNSTSLYLGFIPFPVLNGAPVAFNANKRWNAWTPTVSLQKQFDPQTMAYISASRGFKSGGFNGRANSAAETKTAEYNPEYVWTYEAGLKWRSADNKLQANVAAFHSDYTDFQARVSEIQNPGSITPTFAFPVLNAAKLKMDGIEIEAAAVLGQGTRLSAQIGLMNARYAKFVDARLDPANPAYNPNLHKHVPFSPSKTLRLAATQSFNLADGGAITLGADWSYRGETWLSVDNYDALSQKAYSVTGAFGIYDSANGHWQLRAGVRNLGDKVYKTDGQEFSSVGNIRTAYYGMPRNYYASVRYNF